jgi:ferredoxin-NADP reductase
VSTAISVRGVPGVDSWDAVKGVAHMPNRESMEVGGFAAELVVEHKEVVADDVVVLHLRHPEGAALPTWTPGAHVDVLLDGELTRQYSLCGDPSDPRTWRIGVLRAQDSRGCSVILHDRIARGASVRVRGPRNHFPVLPSGRYVFIAGGIGITPLIPMIAQAQASGAEWSLLYGGRRRGSMAFLDELAGYGDRVTVWPEDEKGLLPLDAVLGTPDDDTLVYCCGPEGLLQAVESRCATWPPGCLHVERFTPRPVSDPTDVHTFELVLEQSGLTLEVPPDRSILDVVEEAGVPVVTSCREGTCGSCETPVLAGEPDHRDSVLSTLEREAGDLMMICVSRALGERLVLDL